MLFIPYIFITLFVGSHIVESALVLEAGYNTAVSQSQTTEINKIKIIHKIIKQILSEITSDHKRSFALAALCNSIRIKLPHIKFKIKNDKYDFILIDPKVINFLCEYRINNLMLDNRNISKLGEALYSIPFIKSLSNNNIAAYRVFYEDPYFKQPKLHYIRKMFNLDIKNAFRVVKEIHKTLPSFFKANKEELLCVFYRIIDRIIITSTGPDSINKYLLDISLLCKLFELKEARDIDQIISIIEKSIDGFSNRRLAALCYYYKACSILYRHSMCDISPFESQHFCIYEPHLFDQVEEYIKKARIAYNGDDFQNSFNYILMKMRTYIMHYTINNYVDLLKFDSKLAIYKLFQHIKQYPETLLMIFKNNTYIGTLKEENIDEYIFLVTPSKTILK